MEQSLEETGGDGPLRWLLAIALVAVCAVTAWALVEAVGPDLRRWTMIETVEDPSESLLVFENGSTQAAAFFSVRDTVRFMTPRSMTLGELLAFYHLENNPGAREAVERATGTTDLRAVVPSGTSLTLPLTPTRVGQP